MLYLPKPLFAIWLCGVIVGVSSCLRFVLPGLLTVVSLARAQTEAVSPFHPVVTVEEEQALHLTLVGNTPIIQYDNDGLALATLGPHGVVKDERLTVGIAQCAGGSTTTSFSGRFPGAAWLVKDLHAWSACPDDDPHILHWTGSGWQMVETISAHDVLVAPWKRGSALVVEVPRRVGPPLGYELHLLHAPAGLEPPKPKMASRQPGSLNHCYTELEGPAFLSTGEDGSILLGGTSRCINDDRELDGRPVVEYFAPGARRGHVLVAPIKVDMVPAMAFVRMEHGFWVGGASAGGRSMLARFDGTTWSKTVGPPGQLLSFSVDGAGSIWAIAQSDDAKVVWRKRAAGKWSRVPLPQNASPIYSLVARRGGDAWLVAGRAVYSTLPVRDVLVWVSHECNEAEMERAQSEETVIHSVKPRDGESPEPCCVEPSVGPRFQ
jgi:hypothetical protein